MKNHSTNSQGKFSPKIMPTILVVAIFVIYYLASTGYFTRLIFMNVNSAYTKQFNLHYKGPEFDSLRISCNYKKADVEFVMAGQKYEFDDSAYSCLTPPDYDANFSVYLEIIRTSENNKLYEVRTTGEEMKGHYTPSLTKSLIEMVGDYYDMADHENKRKQTWIDAS